MVDSKRPAESDDPRVYFAAERTLLAWIRTGLALMGFGFIVARFGLFLREIAMVHEEPASQRTGFSLAIGVTLVLLGVAVTAWAAAKHYRWVKLLRGGKLELPRAFSMSTLLAVALAILGLLVVVFLLFGLNH